MGDDFPQDANQTLFPPYSGWFVISPPPSHWHVRGGGNMVNQYLTNQFNSTNPPDPQIFATLSSFRMFCTKLFESVRLSFLPSSYGEYRQQRRVFFDVEYPIFFRIRTFQCFNFLQLLESAKFVAGQRRFRVVIHRVPVHVFCSFLTA